MDAGNAWGELGELAETLRWNSERAVELARHVLKRDECGQFDDGDVLENESWIGSRFSGRIVGRAKVGDFDAIIPAITGRAWIMGTAQWRLDPTDPFPTGFLA